MKIVEQGRIRYLHSKKPCFTIGCGALVSHHATRCRSCEQIKRWGLQRLRQIARAMVERRRVAA